MAVFGLVSAVAGFVKVRYAIEKATIDNMIFRLHYRLTSAILFACCIIVTANNLIGEPIACINDAVSNHVISSYCWITYTFTMPGQHGKRLGTDVPHSGLGNDNDEKIYHSYYQWVPFVLFIQGLCFYAPHFIWKNIEGGKLRNITEGLRGCMMLSKGERTARLRRLGDYIDRTPHMHREYMYGYLFCEALNLVNVIMNIVLMDRFLGGSFMTYGTDVWRFSNMNQENRSDPMVEVFPRVTKCTFHKFGASGSIQKHDALCVLALNILNEKIYIFLWFWMILLAVASAGAIVFSGLLWFQRCREIWMKSRAGSNGHIVVLARNLSMGDFMLLHLLSKNINAVMYDQLLSGLCGRWMTVTDHDEPSVPPIGQLEMAPMYYQDKEF